MKTIMISENFDKSDGLCTQKKRLCWRKRNVETLALLIVWITDCYEINKKENDHNIVHLAIAPKT